jgi:SAM-dependent methyltransferase
MPPLDANENSEVYYQGHYWNDLDCTNRMINHRISGDWVVNWWQHFARRSGRVFARALILNCGNGWVEREMFDGGLVKEAVGIDYSEALLDEARSAAQRRPLRYVQTNINTDPLPPGPFDLVVNHAAAHHVARIDRVFRSICGLLPEDGWFISFDYVGPHRNQYAPSAWDRAWSVNQTLPPHLRQAMVYPSLDAMVHIDPTEAVHSELIVDTLYRYFHVAEFVPLGGALAYPILTHNAQFFSGNVDARERERWGQHVLDHDARYLAENPQSSLFAYFTGQPRKEVLLDDDTLEMWKRAEEERETNAAREGGRYYERSMLQDLYEEISGLQQANAALREELDTIRGSYLYDHLTRVLNVPLVRRVLQSKLVRALRR